MKQFLKAFGLFISIPLFAQNNILTVIDMYTLELGVFMYKFHINDLPVAFKYYFTKRSDIHDYPTRQAKYLNVTFNKKSFSDHSIRTGGPTYPLEFTTTKIKESKTVKHFRNQFKQTLIQNYK